MNDSYSLNGCMINQHIKSFGLPRTRKITKADAFASALRMRVCARTDDFVLHFMAHRSGTPTTSAYRSNSDLTQPWPQLGLVVPKRFAKHAVRRNLIKRLARECFRQYAGQRGEPLNAGLWVVRLNRSISDLPLSSSQKRQWAAQLANLFAQGHDFAIQMSQRSARPTQTASKVMPDQAKGED